MCLSSAYSSHWSFLTDPAVMCRLWGTKRRALSGTGPVTTPIRTFSEPPGAPLLGWEGSSALLSHVCPDVNIRLQTEYCIFDPSSAPPHHHLYSTLWLAIEHLLSRSALVLSTNLNRNVKCLQFGIPCWRKIKYVPPPPLIDSGNLAG